MQKNNADSLLTVSVSLYLNISTNLLYYGIMMHSKLVFNLLMASFENECMYGKLYMSASVCS